MGKAECKRVTCCTLWTPTHICICVFPCSCVKTFGASVADYLASVGRQDVNVLIAQVRTTCPAIALARALLHGCAPCRAPMCWAQSPPASLKPWPWRRQVGCSHGGVCVRVSACSEVRGRKGAEQAQYPQRPRGTPWQMADVIILTVGYNNKDVEREGSDHLYTTLPGLQTNLTNAVVAAGTRGVGTLHSSLRHLPLVGAARGTPVIMVLVNAGQIALDSLDAQPPAIVEAFYPAFGAPAIVAQVRLPAALRPSHCVLPMRCLGSLLPAALWCDQHVGPSAIHHVPPCVCFGHRHLRCWSGNSGMRRGGVQSHLLSFFSSLPSCVNGRGPHIPLLQCVFQVHGPRDLLVWRRPLVLDVRVDVQACSQTAAEHPFMQRSSLHRFPCRCCSFGARVAPRRPANASTTVQAGSNFSLPISCATALAPGETTSGDEVRAQ